MTLCECGFESRLFTWLTTRKEVSTMFPMTIGGHDQLHGGWAGS